MDRGILNLQPAWLDAQRPRLGRYVLGPLLGKGGMGEVSEAWDVVLCRTVALKILHNVDPTGMIRFMHEAQLQARLVHPNICRIYDVDASEGSVKIAMQLVGGPNLEQARSDLSLPVVVTLIAQVAEAVHAAHRLHLIHRDLKPSNILLERTEEGRWFPYICDFGLAMAMDEPALTYSRGVMGTPAYMAPEQFQGDRGQVGPATDVYGLGGALHFALLGKPPEGPLGQGPASPAEFRSQRQELPRELAKVLGKCLAADPQLRYPTAAALAEDLWRFLNGEPVLAQPPGQLTRLWRRVRPYGRTCSEVALVLACLLGGWFGGRAQQGRDQARRTAALAFCAHEGADLEKDLRLERMQAIHDLRPAYARARARLDAIRARMAGLGSELEGPGRLILGQAELLLGDLGGAQADAEKAWASAPGDIEAAGLLGSVLAGAALFTPAGAVPPALPRIERLLQAEPALDHQRLALLALLRQDYPRATLEARSELKHHPWRGEAAQLECLGLAAQGQTAFDQGDFPAAEANYRTALETAERFLLLGPSEERVQHAYLLAGRGLAELDIARGSLAPDLLENLQRRCERAQRLDPGSDEFHEDWLGLQALKARRLAALGQDPGPVLDTALIYLGTRLKEPVPPALLAQRRALYLAQATWNFNRSGDPGPALAEALKAPTPAALLRRDSLGEALTLKAKVDATRGVDPRPAVQAALAHFQPRLQRRPPWLVCEWAASALLAQAQWEGAHGLDPRASLEQAQGLVQAGLQENAGSSRLALGGLIRLKERLEATDMNARSLLPKGAPRAGNPI
jgi:serine/threonine-protein kinase